MCVKILTNEINELATGHLPHYYFHAPYSPLGLVLCILTTLSSFYAQAHLCVCVCVCFCVSEGGNSMECDFKLKSQHKLSSLQNVII
jgi:hypothetical protein